MRIMAFINSFLSYLLVFFVFCIVGGFGIFMGITLRKRKTPRKKIKVKRQKPYNNHGHMAAGSEKGLIRIR